jgi:alkylated DNA repair protein (DNA oxidative demethylase)
MLKPTIHLGDAPIYAGYFNSAQQHHLIDEIRNSSLKTPPIALKTPGGRSLSVRTTSMGKYGWYSDERGYRYTTKHRNGNIWPPIPTMILQAWTEITGQTRQPDCCLVNYYSENAKMGLHQDRDEADFHWPVLSISLGDDALFRMGGSDRKDKTESIWLSSGDVLVMGGKARMGYHGIDRVRFGSSALLRNGGRLNLTLRVVD